MKRTLYLCRCGSLQHCFVVSSEDSELFLEVHLSPLPFWQRVGNAVRYVFGHRSKYGDFEEVLLTPFEALDLGDRLIEWSTGESVAFAPNDVY